MVTVWEVLYTLSVFHAYGTTNIAAIGSSCLGLTNQNYLLYNHLAKLIEIW